MRILKVLGFKVHVVFFYPQLIKSRHCCISHVNIHQTSTYIDSLETYLIMFECLNYLLSFKICFFLLLKNVIKLKIKSISLKYCILVIQLKLFYDVVFDSIISLSEWKYVESWRQLEIAHINCQPGSV